MSAESLDTMEGGIAAVLSSTCHWLISIVHPFWSVSHCSDQQQMEQVRDAGALCLENNAHQSHRTPEPNERKSTDYLLRRAAVFIRFVHSIFMKTAETRMNYKIHTHARNTGDGRECGSKLTEKIRSHGQGRHGVWVLKRAAEMKHKPFFPDGKFGLGRPTQPAGWTLWHARPPLIQCSHCNAGLCVLRRPNG